MSIPKNAALIFGGTGAVGKSVVRDALASNAFTRVLTLGRRAVPIDDTFTNTTILEQKTVSFDDVSGSFPDSDLPQVVFCSLSTTRAQAGSAKNFKKIDQQYVLDSARYIHEKAPKDPVTGKSKVHFLYCSSGGARAGSFFLYFKTKGETEKALAEIGFERVSIFHPSYLKVVEPRDSTHRKAEVYMDMITPLLEFVSERWTTISVASVAKVMRLVGTSDSVEVEGVKPKRVEVNPISKTNVAWYSNGDIHDIFNNNAKV
jgi:oxidoreductase